ncbi:MAG: hypothetical protein RIQ47_1688 [Bacteroidota bacterium]|jgi:hypothetical protein
MRPFTKNLFLQIAAGLLIILATSKTSKAQTLNAQCKSLTVYLNQNGTAFVSPETADSGSATGSGTAPVFQFSNSNLDCSNLGTLNYTLTVFDVGVNPIESSACNNTLTVLDTISPVAVARPITVYLDPLGFATIDPEDLDSLSTDNCGISNFSADITQFNCSMLGTNTVLFTVEDASGNTSTVATTVNVSINAPPTIQGTYFQLEIDPLTGTAEIPTLSLLDGGSSDVCGGPVTIIAADQTVFDCSDLGFTTINITGVDNYGNIGYGTTDVEVLDLTPPAMSCTNYTLLLDPSGNGTLSPNNIDGGATDACGLSLLTVSQENFTTADLGIRNVMLTAIDNAGNTDVCFATVTVITDNNPPVASCQPLLLSLDASGFATAVPTDADAGSFDAESAILTYQLSRSTFDCNDLVGLQIVDLIVTDIYGNQGTCPVDVVVTDPFAPIVTCQDITLPLDANGYATLDPILLDNGSSDNCSPLSYSADVVDFDCSQIGTPQLITFTVTDVAGNSNSCYPYVTVIDNLPPYGIANTVTVYLDVNGQASINDDDLASYFDNCSGVLDVVAAQTTFTCNDIGNQSVPFTVTDASGNTTNDFGAVDVLDTISPTASCTIYTLQLDAQGNGVLDPSFIDNGSFDACPGTLNFVLSQSAFTTADIGTASVTLTVIDASGNSSSCVSNVTVLGVAADITPPVVVCQPVILALDVNGSALLNATDMDAGSFDTESGIATYTVDINTFSCADAGQAIPVTLTVTDNAGNSSSCTDFVLILDQDVPTVNCRNISVTLDANGQATISPADIDNGTTDNCGLASLALNLTTFTTADLGFNTVELTATDASGNSDVCFAQVEVLPAPADVTPPVVVCQPVILALDINGSAFLNATDMDAGSFDTESGIANYAVDINTFSCADAGQLIPVTLTVTDNAGYFATCTDVVYILDQETPTVNCRSIIVALDANGEATITLADIDNGSTDNCPGSLSLSLSNDRFDCSMIGTQTVTLTVTDGSLNSSVCTANVTVVDNIPPQITCNSFTAVLDNSGQASISTSDVVSSSSDNCSTVTLSLSNTQFTAANLGANIVLVTAIDASGNSSNCSTTVTVVQGSNPIANCTSAVVYLDANGNANITAATVDNGSSNTGGALNLSVSPSSFSCANLGSNAVTLTADDGNGLSSTCPANVFVLDTIHPTINCPGNITALANPITGTAVVNYTISAFDNCSVGTPFIIIGLPSGSAFPIGNTTVFYEVSDASGNSSNCSFVVSVVAGALTSTFSLSADSVQYSDAVTFTATIPNGAGPTPAAQSVTFRVGTQTIGTATLVANGSNLVASLVNAPMLEPTPYGTPPTGQLSPGLKQVTATFNSINPAIPLTAVLFDTLVITPENAQVDYTGMRFVNTTSANSGNAVVNLTATVNDPSLFIGAADALPGNVRNATVTFINRDNGTIIATGVPVGLIDPIDLRSGTAVFEWNTSIGTQNSQSITVGMVVKGYYSTDSAANDVVVTISRPMGDFVTGGGSLQLSTSSGTYAGDEGSKTNFGFNVKYNRSGQRLQGAANFVFRKTINGATRTFQIKGSMINTLVVDSASGKFSFTGKGNVSDITSNRGNGNLFQNATFRVSGTDRGEPGSLDSLSIIVYRDNAVWFASSWGGISSFEEKISNGNLISRISSTNVRFQNLEANTKGIVTLDQNYPNPANTYTNFTLQSVKDIRLSINIVNIEGRLVSSMPEQEYLKDTPYTLELDVTGFPAGIYFINVLGDGVVESKKMWVIHQ